MFKKNEIAIFKDLSEEFVLTVNLREGWFEWSHVEEYGDGSKILIKIKEGMDDVCKGSFLKEFDSFSKLCRLKQRQCNY